MEFFLYLQVAKHSGRVDDNAKKVKKIEAYIDFMKSYCEPCK